MYYKMQQQKKPPRGGSFSRTNYDVVVVSSTLRYRPKAERLATIPPTIETSLIKNEKRIPIPRPHKGSQFTFTPAIFRH